jgi:hypothetical protein
MQDAADRIAQCIACVGVGSIACTQSGLYLPNRRDIIPFCFLPIRLQDCFISLLLSELYVLEFFLRSPQGGSYRSLA